MTTANLSVGIKTNSALQSLRELKAMMKSELKGGIMLSVDAGSLVRSVQDAVRGERFKLEIDASHLRSQITGTVKQAFAETHRLNFDAVALTTSIRAAVAAGMSGGAVSVSGGAGGNAAVSVDQVRSILTQTLVPAVDKLTSAASLLGKADRAASTTKSALRASESAGYLDSNTGKRISVVKTLDNPLEALKKAEADIQGRKEIAAAKQQSEVRQALLNQRMAEIGAAEQAAAVAEVVATKNQAATRQALVNQRMAEIASAEQAAASAEAAATKNQNATRQALTNQRLAEIAAAEQVAAREEVRTMKGRTTTHQALLNQRLAEVGAAEKAAAANEVEAVKKKDAVQKALLNQRLTEIGAAEREATAAMMRDVKAHFNAIKFDASAKYTPTGAKIVAAQSVASRFGTETATTALGADSHLLGRLAQDHLKAAAAAKVSAAEHSLVRTAMNDAHSASRGLAGSLGMLWATWGSTVPIVAMAAIGSAMVSVFKFGKDVEYQLRFVSALTDGSAVSIKEFGDVVRGGMVMPGEAASAMRALAQNGLSVREAFQALPDVLALATAGEMSLTDAALGATGVMAAFNLQISDLGRISDVFAKAAALSNTSVTGMTEAMKQASTVSDNYHVTLEETAAALATLAKMNIQGTAAGTAFRNMWVELATPTKKASGAMAELDLKVFDLNKRLVGSSEIYQQLHDKLASFNEESKLSFLNDMFGERGGKAANAIISNLEQYKDTLRKVKEESKDFTKGVVQALNDTAQGKLKALFSEFQLSAVEAFDQSSASVKGFVDSLRLVVRSDEFGNTLKSLSSGVVELTRFLMDNSKAIVITLAAWKGTQYLLATITVYRTLAVQAAATGVAVTAMGMAGRAAMSAMTGGLSLVVALAAEYFLLAKHTSTASQAQLDYNNALALQGDTTRTSIKLLEDRIKLLDRQNVLMRSGDTEAEARRKAEKEQSKSNVDSLAKEAAAFAEKINATRQALLLESESVKALEARKGNKGRGLSGAPDLALNAAKARRDQLTLELAEQNRGAALLAVNMRQAAKEHNLKSLADDASFANERLSKLRALQDRNASALKADPSLKLPLIDEKLAPKDRAGFEKFKNDADDQFNSSAKNRAAKPDKEAISQARAAERANDNLLKATDARDRALAELAKTNSAIAQQNLIERVNAEQDINQASYDSGLKSYSGYIRERERLAEMERASSVVEAKKLAAELNEASRAEATAFALSDEKDPDDLLRMQAKVIQAQDRAAAAEAAATRAANKASSEKLSSHAKTASGVHSTVQAAKDAYSDSIQPGKSEQSRLDTIAANMRAEIELYTEGAEEKKRLLKEVDEYVAITERKMASEAMANWVNSLTGSLRTAAEGFATLSKGVEQYTLSQAQAQSAKEDFAKQKTEAKGDTKRLAELAKLESASIKKTEREQLNAYASMAASGKKFFKEHTAGYKVLEAAERSLRTYQMVMSAKALAEDLSNLAVKVGTWIFGEATMTAATSAGSLMRGAMVLAEAAANGVLAVVKAIASMPFPANLAAGVATAAVVGSILGSAFKGGGGGGASSAEMQKTQGTGTVAGDPLAKSASITNSLKQLEELARPELKYTSQMAASLRNIEGSIVGVAGQIMRSGGAVTGANFSATATQNNAGMLNSITKMAYTTSGLMGMVDKMLGGLGGKILTSVLGGLFGKTKTNLQDSGVQFGAGSLQSILSGGVSAISYQSTETVKKQLWGAVKSKSYNTNYGGLDSNITNQFSNLIKDTYSGVIAATTALGISAEVTKGKLAGFTVDLGRISLKGLNSGQIQEQLTAVFGAFADRLSAAADSTLIPFQQAGEGYFETLTRVASGVENAKSYMDKLGITMINYTDILNVQADVSTELVRDSILAKEGLTGIGEVINGLSGTASDLAETYTTLLGVRYALAAFGSTAVSVSADMIAGAGSLDDLAQGATDYTDNVLYESERLAKSTADMAREFARIGLVMPTTNEGFKSLLLGIDGSTDAGQRMYGALLSLTGQFTSMTEAAKAFDSSKLDMQIALLKAQSKDEQALALERKRTLDATDPMLKALQEQVWAAEDAATATQKLTESLNKLNDAGKTISDYLDSLNSSASSGSKLDISRSAYLSNLSLAKTDDLSALGKVTSLATAYLSDAQNSVSTQAQYLAIVAQVRAELGGLHATTSYRASLDGSHANGLDYVPYDGYRAELHKGERVQTASSVKRDEELAAELKALREDLKAANAALATYAMRTMKVIEKWEAVGMPAEREPI